MSVWNRIVRRLTYANVTATLALFVALGGASYAALELPANSVGPRQLAFPLGLAAGNGGSRTVPVTGCQGDISCPGPIPSRLASTSFTLKRPSRLLVMGSATFIEADGSTGSVTVDIGPDIANAISMEQHQVGPAPATLRFSRVVSARAGHQVISLEADAQPDAGSVRSVRVYNPQIAVIALPAIR
jgi:hypothetical protein